MNAVSGVRLEILVDIYRNPDISTLSLVARKRMNTRHHIAGLRNQGFIRETFHGRRHGEHRWQITSKGLNTLCPLKNCR